jgi:hypothetical protein
MANRLTAEDYKRKARILEARAKIAEANVNLKHEDEAQAARELRAAADVLDPPKPNAKP